MSTHWVRHANPVPAISRVPVRSGILQRECDCGGASGPSGTCSSCRRQHPLGGLLQAKLRINQPDDPFEREADRVAEQVMRTPAPALQRQIEEKDEEDLLQRQPQVQQRVAGHEGSTEAPPIVHEVLRSPDRPLDASTRTLMESRFGHDFGHVRVHTNAAANHSAELLRANAYTIGHDVVFGRGTYQPVTPAGRRLIAHELAHVVQQTGDRRHRSGTVPHGFVQKQDDGGLPPGGPPLLPESIAAPPEPTTAEEQTPSAALTEVRPSERQRVQRMVMSCADMQLRLETATTVYIYTLEECSLPVGSYETQVTVTGNDFFLDFGAAARADEEFSFRYRVDPGQENPAVLLGNQTSVRVDVVNNLPVPSVPEQSRQTPQCVKRLEDRVLVPADSLTRNLFEPIRFNQTIWSHPIPLGQFGWVEVDATASGHLSGLLSAHYGPGRLTDICLIYLIDRQTSSAPIQHPLLGRGSRADVTTYGIGGRARFTLPARATIRIAGEGKLRIAGDYLSLIEVAAAEGSLRATGEATLAGEINGAVEVVARATRSSATLQHPILPLQVMIENSTIDAVDLAAEIGLRGRAGLMFRVDLSAGFDLAGFNLWRQSWNLAQFNAGISWSGALKYSPNPGIHWDLGTLGVNGDVNASPGEDEGLDDTGFREDSAEVEEEDLIEALLNESQAQVSAPDGSTEAKALPFDWYKPLELYPTVIDIPNADEPHELRRDDGPTLVRYQERGRTRYESFGVADWPAVNRSFEYFPYSARRTPEQSRFNRLLDRLGYNRSGVDAEHVWDVKLRGLEYDRFDNLWPASNQEQQLAGTRHDRQIRNYERTMGNISGHWFKIARVLHPA